MSWKERRNKCESHVFRYEMDEDVDMDGTGEKQSDFHEYRKELRHVMHAITLKVHFLFTLIHFLLETGQTTFPLSRSIDER